MINICCARRWLVAALATIVISTPVSAQILPPTFFGMQQSSTTTGTTSSSDPSVQTANTAQQVSPTQPTTQAQPTAIAPPPVSPPLPTNPIPTLSPASNPGKIFGDQLFGGMFRANLNPGFNQDYQIAIGDRIAIHLWGAVNFDGSLPVDARGNIFVPNIGSISVAGVPNGELNRVVEAAVRKIYRNGTWVYAALDVSQPVKVYVTGYVLKPGLYTGVASDSAISFLDKAGGVDPDRGSYLDIVVKRGNQIRKRIDLYKFLQDGVLDLVQFQDGDVILVAPRMRSFSIAGDVYNSMVFEFSQNSISLRQALDMAKIQPGANHVSIIRKQGAEMRSEYFELSDIAGVMVFDGDEVNVYTDRYPGTIQVRVDGAHSGSRALVLPYGATLSDALATVKPNGMSRMDAIFLTRKSVMQKQKDMLAISLQKLEESVLSARSRTSEEAMLRSKEAELVLRFIDRGKQVQPQGTVVLDERHRGTTLLEDGDVVVIPQRTSLVMVSGEVLFPAAVSWREGADSDSYIEQTGGYTQGANTARVVVMAQNGQTRLADSSTPIATGDQILVLPRVETKSVEVTRAITQILYQIAFSARVAFGL